MVHSATPWRASGRYVFLRNDCIAVCDTDNNPPAVMEGNARFIARAANAHSEAIDLLSAVTQSDGRVTDLLFNQILAFLRKVGAE